MSSEDIKKSWQLKVNAHEKAFIKKPFFGITFFERRLREAKKCGIDHVYVTTTGGLNQSDLPALSRADLCTTWSLVPTPEPTATEVPHLALIDASQPQKEQVTIESLSDWDYAKRWFQRKIIHDSGAGWIAKYLNKPFSLAVSTRLSETKLTPNQWSYINLLIGFFFHPSAWAVALGGFLFQLASVGDGVDGEIAKFRVEYSLKGAWLDTLVDNITLAAFLIAAAIHVLLYEPLVRTTTLITLGATAVGVLGYMMVVSSFVHRHFGEGSLVMYEKKFLDRLPSTDPVVRFSRRTRYFIKKDFFSFFFFVLCVTGLIRYLFHLTSLFSCVGLGLVLYMNKRYAHELRTQTTH